MSTPTVFVTSATGTVGSALARQLLSLNWHVHFTTRNATSPAALSLSALGASVFPGSWDDTPALTTALTGCTHLFINTFPNFTDPSKEVSQVTNLLRLAKEAGVTHAIYSGALPTYELPQWDPSHWTAGLRYAKKDIEKAVKESGIRYWTILRPGYFMANFLGDKVDFQFPGATETGVFKHGCGKGEVLPLVDERDIAKFVIAAFQEPERYSGAEIAVASERMEAGVVIEVLRRISRKEIVAKWLTKEEIEKEEGQVKLSVDNQLGFVGLDRLVDWEALKGWGVELGTFEAYLERERESLEETYKGVKGIEQA
jgi:uncharacterized protein YbjT (DUF2867 family)